VGSDLFSAHLSFVCRACVAILPRPDLSRPRFFLTAAGVSHKNLSPQTADPSDHPRFKSVSGLGPGNPDRPARNDNGDKKSLLVGMIAATGGAGKEKSDEKVRRDKPSELIMDD